MKTPAIDGPEQREYEAMQAYDAELLQIELDELYADDDRDAMEWEKTE